MTARILWASPYCLLDTTSGAAIETRCLLEALAARGMEVRALSAFIFDHPHGATSFPNLDDELAEHADKNLFFFELNSIQYTCTRTASRRYGAMTCDEQGYFFAAYNQLLRAFHPDMIYNYGGGMLEMTLRAEARRRGIPVVCPICNGSYEGYAFPDTDLLVTTSHATSRYYKERDALRVLPTGPFIHPDRVLAPQRTPTYITFVNPVPEKGVALVARLIQMAREELPDQRFLVVQSRGNWAASLAALKPGDDPFVPADLADPVDVAEHTTDMRPVYAHTKILLAPSLWYEAFGMVAAEACMNGIPVIASTSGGLPEAVGQGGILIQAPERCRNDFLAMPSREETRPWLDALKAMLATEHTLDQWSQKAREAAQVHALDRSVDRALELFAPLLARSAGNHPQLYRSGSHTGR